MTPLDKYGDKALTEREQEEAEELRQVKGEGTEESVYGPMALAGEGDPEKVERAAERAGVDVPEGVVEGEAVEAEETAETASQVSEPAPDSEEPPEGYEIEHIGGGYYEVTDPNGDQVESPERDSGTWEGKQLAVAAAWQDAGGDGSGSSAGPGPDEQVSVEELEEILGEDPTLIDERMHAEFGRAEGPRPDALRVMIEVEEENQNRENVLSTLHSAIEDFGSDEE